MPVKTFLKANYDLQNFAMFHKKSILQLGHASHKETLSIRGIFRSSVQRFLFLRERKEGNQGKAYGSLSKLLILAPIFLLWNLIVVPMSITSPYPKLPSLHSCTRPPDLSSHCFQFILHAAACQSTLKTNLNTF